MRALPIIILAVVINLLLSYFMLLYNQPINVDGILYIHSAQAYLQNGFHAAATIYSWPFYSVLLAKVAVWLNLSLLNTGFILNGFFTSILIIFFLLSLQSIENSPKLLLWGAAVILLFPALNHDRYNILRDIPYYAAFIFSFWAYLNFLKTHKNLYAILWQLGIMTAVLFRIEGAVFLILIPVFTAFIPVENLKHQLLNLIKLSWVVFLLLFLSLIVFRHVLDFGRLPELMANLNITSWLSMIQQKISELKIYLGVLGQDSAGIFLLNGLIGILITSLATTLGLLASVILIYGAYKKLLPQNSAIKSSFAIYILINLIILTVFMAHQLFMNWRYVFPVVLILLLYIPVILSKLPSVWVGMIYLIFNAAASFGQFGPSNSYMVEAGNWIAKNTPETSKIYSTDETTAFYANRTLVANIKNSDYVIIISKIHNPTAVSLKTQPLMVFHNKRGDTVYIFKN